MARPSDELLELAGACAARVDLPKARYPTFSEVEEECEDEYEQLLTALHEDEIFEPVNLDAQQDLADRLKDALPEEDAALVDELVDNHVRHLWMQQEAAYYVGLALGLRARGSHKGRPRE
jgi:hypothetical protein